jgi:drug/metabolite transporter (DMT)-like permease
MSATPVASASAPRRTLTVDVVAALIIVWVVWGSTYLAIKIGVQSLPPFMLTSGRFLLAGVLLLVLARLRREAWPSVIQWRNAFIVGALMMGGGVGLTSFAEQTNSSSLTTVIVAAGSLANLFAVGLIVGEWPGRREWAGVAVALCGTLLLAFDGDIQAAPAAAAVQIGAVTCWAVGTALTRRLQLSSGAMGNASQMLAGGAVVGLVSVLWREQLPSAVPMAAVGAWLYLALIGSVLAYSAYMHLVKNARPALTTSYSYVNTVVALVLGYFVLNERVSVPALAAVALILVGVVMISRAKSVPSA